MSSIEANRVLGPFKVMVVGETSTGKTCFIRQGVEQAFDENYKMTIGTEFMFTTVEVGGKKVKLQIWDTAGQERFAEITKSVLSGTHAAIVVCDVERPATIESIARQRKILDSRLDKSIPRVLVANKCDVIKDAPPYPAERAAYFANDPLHLAKKCNEENFCSYFYGSAKTGENVRETLDRVAQEILKNPKNLEASVAVPITQDSCCSSS